MVQPSGVHPARGPPAQPVYDARTRWWEPERPADGSGSLSADQVKRWREDGFLAIDGLWEAPLIAAAKAEAEAYFPRAGEEAAHSDAYVGGGADLPKDQQPVDREGRPWPGYLHRSAVVWPSMPFMSLEDPAASCDMALNKIAIHPPALAAVAQLMATTVDDLRLSQCALRARYGPQDPEHDPGDQAAHVDYGNNSLVVPSRSAPDACAAILYYDDVEEVGAPTHAAKARPGELTSHDDITAYAPRRPESPALLPGDEVACAPPGRSSRLRRCRSSTAPASSSGSTKKSAPSATGPGRSCCIS